MVAEDYYLPEVINPLAVFLLKPHNIHQRCLCMLAVICSYLYTTYHLQLPVY